MGGAAEMPDQCGRRLWGLVACFAVGMLLFEVCMEALFSLPDVPGTMSLWNTTVQFVFCSVVPGLAALLQGRRRAPSRNAEDVEEGDASVAAKGAMEARSTLQLVRSWAPYLAVSALQFAAGAAANHSVVFVDFTVKVVFKASKLLPTMALSSLCGNSRAFTAGEYTAAALLCCGTAMFCCGGGKGRPMFDSLEGSAMGLLLLLFSVLAEGVLPNAQQALLRGGCSPDGLTIRINVAGAAGGILGLAISGDWRRVAAYAEEVPAVAPLLLAGGLSFSAAVMGYMRLIEEAGSVFAVGVSTFRKSATVLLSFMLFPGKAFNAVRGLGLGAVFAGLVVAELSRGRLGVRRLEGAGKLLASDSAR